MQPLYLFNLISVHVGVCVCVGVCVLERERERDRERQRQRDIDTDRQTDRQLASSWMVMPMYLAGVILVIVCWYNYYLSVSVCLKNVIRLRICACLYCLIELSVLVNLCVC